MLYLISSVSLIYREIFSISLKSFKKLRLQIVFSLPKTLTVTILNEQSKHGYSRNISLVVLSNLIMQL